MAMYYDLYFEMVYGSGMKADKETVKQSDLLATLSLKSLSPALYTPAPPTTSNTYTHIVSTCSSMGRAANGAKCCFLK